MRGSGLNHADGIARIASSIGFGAAAAGTDMIVSVTYQSQSVQGDVAIVPATSARLVKAFVELPYTVYASDPHWVPPLRRDEYRRLDARKNPFLEHADMDLWVAFDANGPCRRIAAIEDRAHNDFHHERLPWFRVLVAQEARTAHP